jgi:hypothetical protein
MDAIIVANIKTIPPIVGVFALLWCLSGAHPFMGCTLDVFFAHFIKIGRKKIVNKRAIKNDIPALIVIYPNILISKNSCSQ